MEAFSVHLRAEGNDPYSILKDLNSYDDIVARRGNVATQQINKTQSFDASSALIMVFVEVGAKVTFTTGYYAVFDLDSDSAGVGPDW